MCHTLAVHAGSTRKRWHYNADIQESKSKVPLFHILNLGENIFLFFLQFLDLDLGPDSHQNLMIGYYNYYDY